jgi:hypothetical protein
VDVTVSGSLSMVVIRACTEHGPDCEQHRTIEDLGVVASFLKERRTTTHELTHPDGREGDHYRADDWRIAFTG